MTPSSKRLYIVPGHDIQVDLLLVLSTYSVSIFVKYILYIRDGQLAARGPYTAPGVF